ncbi:MAG TPA: sugar ABC transporter permease [Armatimonadota bacterium]|jgi:multiple sugar transport system permease protein
MKRKRTGETGRDGLAALAFLTPSFVGLFIFSVIPILGAIGISLLEWDILSPPKFVGFANYTEIWRELVSGEVLRQVILNTLYFTAVTVPLAMAVSLGISLLLNRKIRGVAAFRVIYFLPSVTSIVALSIIWRLMYNPDYGLINRALGAIRIPGVANGHLAFVPLIPHPPAWLGDPNWAMPAIIIMSVWTGIGYNAILYLAGLQGIGKSYYEAARLDGAGAWQVFRHVTWPLLSPTTLFIFTMSVIGGFQVFTQIFMMTAGNPRPQTMVFVYHIYSQAFTSFKMGYASALAVLLFLIILSVTLGQLAATKRWVNYGN